MYICTHVVVYWWYLEHLERHAFSRGWKSSWCVILKALATRGGMHPALIDGVCVPFPILFDQMQISSSMH